MLVPIKLWGLRNIYEIIITLGSQKFLNLKDALEVKNLNLFWVGKIKRNGYENNFQKTINKIIGTFNLNLSFFVLYKF